MTIGEKIQYYRKNQKLSQDELGQKLYVSRQTISQWETNQTIPTIDNLIRLKEIFGVSVDEILCCEGKSAESPTPEESYDFTYSKTEISEINNSPFFIYIFGTILSAILFVSTIISFAINPSETQLFVLSILWLCVFVSIGRALSLFLKMRKSNLQRIPDNLYHYEIYGDFLILRILRRDETIKMYKIGFDEIENVRNLGSYFIFIHLNQSFIIRKETLNTNSKFYTILENKTPQKAYKPCRGKWRAASIALAATSVLSLFAGIICANILSPSMQAFAGYLWILYLFTPIPLASVAFGYILRKKGLKWKKNVVIGIIFTMLLILYGSFTFLIRPADYPTPAETDNAVQTYVIDSESVAEE